MLRAPQPIRRIHQRCIEKGEDAEDSGERRAALRFLNQSAQQQIRNVKQPEDKRGRQTRIPSPPNSPSRLAPKYAGGKPCRATDDAHFDGGDSQPIPFGLARNQPRDVGDQGDGKRREHGHPASEMKIKYSLDLVHGGFVWRDEKRRVARKKNQRGGDSAACDAAFHREARTSIHSSSRKSHSSQEAVRNTISNPARNASQARSSAGCSAKSDAVASTAAISNGARIGSSSGKSNSRIRACAAMAEKTVPVTTRPTVPSTKTRIRRPTIPARETL